MGTLGPEIPGLMRISLIAPAAAAVLVLVPALRRVGMRGRTRRRLRFPRAVSLLGLSVALSSLPTQQDRAHASPSRAARPAPRPWLESSGASPPRPPAPLGSPGAHRDDDHFRSHPAVHGTPPAPGSSRPRLFPRAPAPRPQRRPHDSVEAMQREEARRLHPSGRTRPGFGQGPRCGHTYEIESGDSLWSIASHALESSDPALISAYWRRIYRTNAMVLGPDPDLIIPGQVIQLPESCR